MTVVYLAVPCLLGGFVALEGMINYTFGGFAGTFGTVGKKGKLLSLEWWKKATLRKAYTLPFKYILNDLQAGLE